MAVQRRTRAEARMRGRTRENDNGIRLVPTDSLTPDRSNPRKADTARLGLLRLSIAKLGFLMPVYGQKSTGLLLSGHQRQTVCRELGVKQMPVMYLDVEDKDVMGINLLFNRRLAVHEPVVTPTGYRCIGDIEVGDEVYGRDGLPYEVIDKTPTERRLMYKVVFDDGTEILADSEHLWTVEFSSRSQTSYTSVAEVQTADLLRMLQEKRAIRLPTISPVELPAKRLPVDPWLLGALLGDGSLDEHGLRLHTSAPKEWAIARVRSAAPHMRITAARCGACTSIGITGGTRGGVMYNSLLHAIRRMGLSGCRGHEKFVPYDYLWGSVTQRLSILQGLMDSDGSPGAGGGVTPIFTTTSEALADAVVHLTLSLGGKAGKRRMRERTGNWKEAYQVTVRLPEPLSPFTRPDRVSAYAGTGRHRLHRRVTEVTTAGVHEAVCISINSSEHLYLARNFIPTHNCTNDFNAFDTGSKARQRMNMQEVVEALEALPDRFNERHFAIDCKEEPIEQFAESVADQYDKKATTAAMAFTRWGIKIPIVVSESGTVVNGVHRLFAALEKGIKSWPVVRIPDQYAEVALILLNYLSMDFNVDDDFKAILRSGAYRRPSNNRGVVPKSYRFWANGCRTLLDKDSYSTEYWVKFRDLHGHNILDFGAGLGRVAPYLQTKGINAIDFEPYRIDPDKGNGEPCRLYSRQQARRFLQQISDPKLKFDSIFLSSVLNSVPFAEDRLMVLAIVHALCTRATVVYGTCRDISDFEYEYGGIRNAGFFVFDSEPGVRLGDIASRPKIQKFCSEEETKQYLSRFWKTVTTYPGGNIHYWKAEHPMTFNPKVVGQALAMEFSLPFRDGGTLDLVDEAKAAFGKRLMCRIP